MTGLASELEKVLCKNCRLEFDLDALFCPNCGTAKARDLDGDPLVGTTIGDRYLLIEQIGQGTSGAIYLGEHVTLRRKVVIKVLHHELSRDDLAIERFRREATTVGELDNDHIVQIYDFGHIADGRLYLAMEYLEGRTLADIIAEQGRLEIDQVVDLLTQLGEALIEAHAMGYVHRDLRPRNLFLARRRTRANYLKLLDFGLAKLVEKEGEAASTSLGMTFGDPHYMSPEQARGDAVDRRADIYSMGCIAYEMLSGKPPFYGGKVFDVLTRQVEEMPRPLSEVAPDTPPWLERALMRCLAKNPGDRYITVYRLVEALRQGTDSGVIMSDEIARRRPTNPPASVSRAMERARSRSNEMAVPTEDVLDGPTERTPAEIPSKKISEVKGPMGSQTVMGVGLVGEPNTVDKPINVEPSVVTDPPIEQAPTLPSLARQPHEKVASEDRGVRVSKVIEAMDPKPRAKTASQGMAVPVSKMVDSPSSGSSTGLSAVWYADGETLEDGSKLSTEEMDKLNKARGNTPSRTGLMAVSDDEYLDELPTNNRLKIVLGSLGALGLIVVLAASLLSSDEKKASEETVTEGNATAGTAAAKTLRDAPASPLPFDAGNRVAVAADAAPAVAVADPKPVDPKPRVRDPRPVDPKPRVRDPKPVDPKPRVRDPKPDKPSNPIDVSSGPSEAEKAEAAALIAQGSGDLRSGDILGAASKFNKARSLDPSNASSYAGLGNIALSQGSYQAAIGHLKKASKMRPKSAQILTLLGESYLGAGNTTQAADAFKRALKLLPDNARARDGYNEATGN